MKLNYFIHLTHTTNTIEVILGFIRFYVPCSSALMMEEYETLSCVRRYHDYQRVWIAAVGEELWCERERPENPTDPNVIVIKKDGTTGGKSTR